MTDGKCVYCGAPVSPLISSTLCPKHENERCNL